MSPGLSMSEIDPARPAAGPASTQDDRRERRAAARRRQLRRRRLAAGGFLAAALGVAVVLLSGGGGGGQKGSGRPGTGGAGGGAVRPGGPLAPASVGGLAALWAPGNVVGAQPGTAAAYAAASRRPGPPGFILIADRGNNRILVVNPARPGRLPLPRRPRPAAGRLLHFNDDTFVEPGGASLIANEEDNQAIV